MSLLHSDASLSLPLSLSLPPPSPLSENKKIKSLKKIYITFVLETFFAEYSSLGW